VAVSPPQQTEAAVRRPWVRHDYDKYRRLLWKRGIKPLIARRGIAHGSDLGKTRWVVERTFAWLHTLVSRVLPHWCTAVTEREGTASGPSYV
jgi:hypothetical protein